MADTSRERITTEDMARECGAYVYKENISTWSGDYSKGDSMFSMKMLERFRQLCEAPLLAEIERLTGELKLAASAIEQLFAERKELQASIEQAQPAAPEQEKK